MGASAAASAAFGGGGNSAIGTTPTQAMQLAQQLNAMRRGGSLFSNIAELVNQGPQVGTATPEQIAAGNANLANVDYGAEANPTMDQATAVNQTAFGAVPTVATGGFAPGAQQAAAGVFGTEAERQAAMQQAADVSEATYAPVGGNVIRPKRLKGLRF